VVGAKTMPIHVYISGGENRSRTFWKGKNYSKAELKTALRPYGVIVAHSASNQLDYIVLPPGVSMASNSTLKKASNVPEISWSQFEARFLSFNTKSPRGRRGGGLVAIRGDRSWEEGDTKNTFQSLKKLVSCGVQGTAATNLICRSYGFPGGEHDKI
jgi:hypothetical protein